MIGLLAKIQQKVTSLISNVSSLTTDVAAVDGAVNTIDGKIDTVDTVGDDTNAIVNRGYIKSIQRGIICLYNNTMSSNVQISPVDESKSKLYILGTRGEGASIADLSIHFEGPTRVGANRSYVFDNKSAYAEFQVVEYY